MELNMDLPRRDIDLAGLRSYVYRLTERLGVVLSCLDEGNFSTSPTGVVPTLKKNSVSLSELKESIIRTAAVVEKVEEKLVSTMKESYVAKSEIGEYTSEAFADYVVGGKGIEQYFTLVETVAGQLSEISGFVKSGLIDSDTVGIEIGSFGGDDTCPFKVRLSENRLSFWEGQTEVAYLSDSTLYVTKAQIGNSLILGNYHLDLTDGIKLRYMGDIADDGGETEEFSG